MPLPIKLPIDLWSTSSTFDVKSKYPPKWSLRTTPTKCVRFKTTKAVVYISQRNKDDTRNLWYNAKDYQKFRNDACSAAKEIIRFENECEMNPNSYRNVMERVYNACRECTSVSKGDERRFETWVAATVGRTGLEQVAISSIRQDTKIRRKELVNAVLQIQKDETYSSAERAKMISRTAREITQVSRLFSMHLAHAQAALV